MNGTNKATDCDRFQAVPTQPCLGNTTRRQTNGDHGPVILDMLAIETAEGGIGGHHFLSYSLRYIDSHPVGLRFGQGLPAYEHNLW